LNIYEYQGGSVINKFHLAENNRNQPKMKKINEVSGLLGVDLPGLK
jgi:hypothetical protein